MGSHNGIVRLGLITLLHNFLDSSRAPGILRFFSFESLISLIPADMISAHSKSTPAGMVKFSRFFKNFWPARVEQLAVRKQIWEGVVKKNWRGARTIRSHGIDIRVRRICCTHINMHTWYIYTQSNFTVSPIYTGSYFKLISIDIIILIYI